MINCKNNTVMSGYPAAARTRAAKSGRQACDSDTTSQVRPPGVRGKASNSWQREENLYPAAARTRQPKVFIKTFGWPFVSALQCLVFVL